MAKSHDVNIWKIAVRKTRHRGHGVRWSVAGNEFSKWFTTHALADNYRAGLLRAIRQGEAFDTDSGQPESVIREQQSVTWFDLACRFTDMRWPRLAAKSRMSIADALATITPALVTTTRGMPEQKILRAALYGWAFNKESRAATEPEPEAAKAIGWIRGNSLPVSALDEKDRRSELVRRALDALSVTMDGHPAAATVVARKRAALLRHPRLCRRARHPAPPTLSTRSAGRPPAPPTWSTAASSPAPARSPSLDAVTPDRPELIAFFACLYYAYLRPAEAAALTMENCHQPKRGWGRLTLTSSAKGVPAAWTDDGTALDQRQLKHRARDAIRVVPIPPVLVAILRHHIDTHGTAPDGRLFQVTRGQRGKGAIITAKIYGPAWHKARAKALSAAQQASPLAGRPYDLRHGGITRAINVGVPAPEVAARAGRSVEVLWRVYAGCIDGHDQLWNHRIEDALAEQEEPTE
jgi:integrase